MKKFGLLGHNISYSFSPKLHKTIFEKKDLKYSYNLFDISELKPFIKNLTKNNISGFNITIPYKRSIIQYLTEISSEAKKIGAVNCVKVINNKLIGFNTDYLGILETFKKMNLNLKNKKVYILGSGGAAVTAYFATISCNGIPCLVSRNKENVENFNCISYEELKNKKGYLLINATPVGTFPNIEESPVEKDIIFNFDNLFDLIYNPYETKFLKFGKELNKNIENGFFMLVSQGVKSEEIWNDISLNTEYFYKILKQQIYKENN